MAANDIRALIRRGRDLDLQIKRMSGELKTIREKICGYGPGEYEGSDGAKALVIFPSPSIKPAQEVIPNIRKFAGRKFRKLFVEELVYRPVAGFRQVLEALFDDAETKEEILKLSEKDGAPQVRFS